jgi:hypothetical protein
LFALDMFGSACDSRDVEFARVRCSNVPQETGVFGTPYPVR